MHEIPRYLRPQDVLQEWGFATRHENIDIPPKELVGLEKKTNIFTELHVDDPPPPPPGAWHPEAWVKVPPLENPASG